MTRSMPSTFFVGGYASVDQPAIQAFLFDGTGGELTPSGSFTGINNPTFLLAHPNGRWLYTVSETGQESHGAVGGVWAFQFQREPFNIQPINHRSTHGDWPCHLRLDHKQKWLLATNYGTGSAGIYPLGPDGSLGEMTDLIQHHGAGPNAARQEGPHTHSSIFAPDNRFVIIADLGIDQLVTYRFDAVTGKLQLHTSVATRPGSGPRHLAFHPNGRWLYTANELDSTVTLYDYDAAKGTLLERQSLSTIPPGSPENIVADIQLSTAGERLYVSNRGHNSIAVYDMAGSGSLDLVSIPDCGGNWPRNLAPAPGGRFMLVANQYSNEVCVLPIRGDAEALAAPVARATVTGASSIQFI